MLRRLLPLAVVLTAVATTVPAHAAGTVKAYLNQVSDDCNSASFVITTSADDSGACVIIPREQYQGGGVGNDSESYGTGKSFKMFRIDTSKPLTGTFALFGSNGTKGTAAPDAPALVEAEFTIKIAKKTIGHVTVSGQALPTAPATQTFSLTIPAALKNVRTNQIGVSVEWSTCVGACGVKVSGASFMNIPTR